MVYCSGNPPGEVTILYGRDYWSAADFLSETGRDLRRVLGEDNESNFYQDGFFILGEDGRVETHYQISVRRAPGAHYPWRHIAFSLSRILARSCSNRGVLCFIPAEELFVHEIPQRVIERICRRIEFLLQSSPNGVSSDKRL